MCAKLIQNDFISIFYMLNVFSETECIVQIRPWEIYQNLSHLLSSKSFSVWRSFV